MPEKNLRPNEQMNNMRNENYYNVTSNSDEKLTQRNKKLEEILPYLLAGESDD